MQNKPSADEPTLPPQGEEGEADSLAVGMGIAFAESNLRPRP